MRRASTTISAGSMADIAFLLLVFFLLVTELNQEQGIRSDLPENSELEDGYIEERNLLVVSLGGSDELMIREEEANLDRLAEEVGRFYSNTGVFAEEVGSAAYPERIWVNSTDEGQDTRTNVAFGAIGAFRQMPERSFIQIRSREDTPYSWYLTVLDEIDRVRNEFRNSLSLNLCGKPLRKLHAENDRDQRLLIGLKAVYPNKVVDYWE